MSTKYLGVEWKIHPQDRSIFFCPTHIFLFYIFLFRQSIFMARRSPMAECIIKALASSTSLWHAQNSGRPRPPFHRPAAPILSVLFAGKRRPTRHEAGRFSDAIQRRL